jgi:xylan 1,4-beta-xylosidase
MTRLLPCLLILLLGACSTSTSRQSADVLGETSWAFFDWFEYEGADPLYKALDAGPAQYVNPIIKGYHPDPSIVRVGEDFYLVTSSFAHFPGIPLFHSRDLVNWEQIGHVLDRPSQLNLDGLEISEGIFAPAIRHHEGTFYVVSTIVQGGGNFVVTATDPRGPWSDPAFLPEVDGIDPSLFFDHDGRAWVMNNGPTIGEPLYDGHRALWIQEFDLERLETTGPRTMIVDGGVDIATEPIWIEAPHIFRVEDWYYLIAAEGGTRTDHSEVVFRSTNVTGPYEPYDNNPILTQRHLDPDRPNPVTSTGHADFVQLPNGEWWAVFLGTRPYDGDYYNTGRESFLLPVRWVDGWPVILEGDDTVPYVHPRPNLPPAAAPSVPTSGNFTHRDEFEREELLPIWTFIRTPREAWFDLGRRPGQLGIQARDVSLADRGQPSFVGRRQQHMHARASTALDVSGLAPDASAGLAAFQNDDHYFYLAVTGGPDDRRIDLEVRGTSDAASTPRIVATNSIVIPAGGLVYLRIRAEGPLYGFDYATEEGDWVSLAEDIDGRALSTNRAGGFVGTFIGLHARAGS